MYSKHNCTFYLVSSHSEANNIVPEILKYIFKPDRVVLLGEALEKKDGSKTPPFKNCVITKDINFKNLYFDDVLDEIINLAKQVDVKLYDLLDKYDFEYYVHIQIYQNLKYIGSMSINYSEHIKVFNDLKLGILLNVYNMPNYSVENNNYKAAQR